PPESVEEALHQRWGWLAKDTRKQTEPYERALVASFQGDFRGAEKGARESLREVEGTPDLNARIGPTLLLLEILLETNQPAEAGAMASDFLKRMVVWQPNFTRDATTKAQFYLEPLLLSVSRRAGPRWEREWRARRDQWLERSKKLGMLSESVEWALG